jgi:hypothetical protein
MRTNGKYTGRLGVGPVAGPSGELLDTTNVERTLVDISVRPAYAGGIEHVFRAFQAARELVSTPALLHVLTDLHCVDPYNQVIGFHLQRTGYPSVEYEPFAALGLNFDFYLAHALKDSHYDATWRLYYPHDLGRASDTNAST